MPPEQATICGLERLRLVLPASRAQTDTCTHRVCFERAFSMQRPQQSRTPRATIIHQDYPILSTVTGLHRRLSHLRCRLRGNIASCCGIPDASSSHFAVSTQVSQQTIRCVLACGGGVAQTGWYLLRQRAPLREHAMRNCANNSQRP